MAPGNPVADAVLSVIRSRRSVRKFTSEPVGREVLERIVSAGAEAPSGANAHNTQFIIIDDPAVMDRIRATSTALKSAPAAIVILLDPTPTKYGEFWIQDASAAMENMLLAAVALGYGACWVEGAVHRAEEDLRKALNVPPNLRVWSLLPVGRPAETPERPAKPQPSEITHYNRFRG